MTVVCMLLQVFLAYLERNLTRQPLLIHALTHPKPHQHIATISTL